jgi:hypothetical protein
MDKLENVNPRLYTRCEQRPITEEEMDEDVYDEFDAREIFGILSF